ncbi:putative serine carboxypeptidase-like 52 isoform X1 [Eutrema salsugineum]|uniref:putative serine carboxypeptidase-like 52 isoform X1 n=1 Tax=Eutrema salsugineum TaxID=72664 RepID=UPI000CED49BC|nr:putative serine carboxypeptidase-like 52 isoform X1 [Eutrema salsugineum]
MSLTIQFLLLLLLVLRSHHVDSGSIVKYLPGFEGPLPFELETGFVNLIECWANNERVREALHVQKVYAKFGHWQRCNKTIPYNYDIVSSVPCHMNNSISGYRSLIYSGDHDITMPFQATKAWIKSLNYPIIDDWRPWMIKDQIAGYTRTYANKMTFATIKGGGHTAEYTPNETFIIFQRWISGQPL